MDRVKALLQLTVFLYVKPSGRVLEAGVNTLQKTLVLKKRAELDKVNKQLACKQHEFKSCMEALAQRRSGLEIKQQQVSQNLCKKHKYTNGLMSHSLSITVK